MIVHEPILSAMFRMIVFELDWCLYQHARGADHRRLITLKMWFVAVVAAPTTARLDSPDRLV